MKRRPLLILALVSLSCDPVSVEPFASKPVSLDDRITITGHICTEPPDPADFPVKVVFIVDESGSMCITDPPGSQSANPNGPCQTFMGNATLDNFCEPDGMAHPGRVCALYDLINQFADSPNVSATMIPFETKIVTMDEYPPDPARFINVVKNGANPNYDTWVENINNLQGLLGAGDGFISAPWPRRIPASPRTSSPAPRPAFPAPGTSSSSSRMACRSPAAQPTTTSPRRTTPRPTLTGFGPTARARAARARAASAPPALGPWGSPASPQAPIATRTTRSWMRSIRSCRAQAGPTTTWPTSGCTAMLLLEQREHRQPPAGPIRKTSLARSGEPTPFKWSTTWPRASSRPSPSPRQRDLPGVQQRRRPAARASSTTPPSLSSYVMKSLIVDNTSARPGSWRARFPTPMAMGCPTPGSTTSAEQGPTPTTTDTDGDWLRRPLRGTPQRPGLRTGQRPGLARWCFQDHGGVDVALVQLQRHRQRRAEPVASSST